ncbi:MAG: ABC transporter ATP-binding protein [Pseudomonadota bacterium]
MPAETDLLLQLRNLALTRADGLQVLQAINLDVQRGEIVAVVGESGSGKSQLLLSLLGLAMPGSKTGGSARFLDQELIGMGESQLRRLRGDRISMLFQDPMSALNPYLPLRIQLIEVLQAHRQIGSAQAQARALEALRTVHMPDPEQVLRQYPHELSGGMRQRAMLAMAILSEPDLLLADEPTTALDVTTQAVVLDLLLELRERLGMSILLVTHDLGVVARTADRAVILKDGQVVEQGSALQLLTAPSSAYGAQLLQAVRQLERPPAELDS